MLNRTAAKTAPQDRAKMARPSKPVRSKSVCLLRLGARSRIQLCPIWGSRSHSL